MFEPSQAVLVVDDNLEAAEAVGALFEVAGYTVWYAPDGTLALEQASVLQPDLVILDIEMPGMNGYEVCRRLRQLEVPRSQRVIALSVRRGWEHARACNEAGFDAWFSKPIDPSLLTEWL